jgi:hypothetical protein
MKYCPEIVAKICKYLESGGTQIGACGYAGISKQTFHNWLHDKIDFLDSVKKAEDTALAAMEMKLSNLAKDGDRAAIMFWLKCRGRGNWREHSVVENTGKVGVDVTSGSKTLKELLAGMGERDRDGAIARFRLLNN